MFKISYLYREKEVFLLEVVVCVLHRKRETMNCISNRLAIYIYVDFALFIRDQFNIISPSEKLDRLKIAERTRYLI